MNRRELLQTAIAGSVGIAVIGLQRACLAHADFGAGTRHPFMSESQRGLIAAIAERIIPETDTPGAIEAAVPEFIELLLSDWYTAEERQPVIEGLVLLDTSCHASYQKNFVSCDVDQQISALHGVQDDEFFQLLKSLTVYGYYTSEVGVKAELILNMAPGRYTTIDFAEVGRQWAS